MDKRKQTDNLMDFDIEIPDIVQQKANDAFKQIQNECKSNKTTVHSNQTNKISHANKRSHANGLRLL